MLARGLGYSKTDGWFDTEDASKVKKCYDLLFAGTSFDDIAKEVGFKTGRGVAWILRNTCWKAIRTYPPNTLRAVPLEKPMGIEPLISPARWAKAQDILDGKRTATRARRRQEYEIALGLGLLRCGCGRVPLSEARIPPRQALLPFLRLGASGRMVRPPRSSVLKADAEFERAVVSFADVATVRAMVEQALASQPVRSHPPPTPSGRSPALPANKSGSSICGSKARSPKNSSTAHRKLAGERRDLEAQLPKAAPVIDPKILASAIAGLFAEFPYLSLEEQHALAHRTFVAFEVDEKGVVDKAVMRGEALSQLCATNGRHSSATK